MKNIKKILSFFAIAVCFLVGGIILAGCGGGGAAMTKESLIGRWEVTEVRASAGGQSATIKPGSEHWSLVEHYFIEFNDDDTVSLELAALFECDNEAYTLDGKKLTIGEHELELTGSGNKITINYEYDFEEEDNTMHGRYTIKFRKVV